MGCGIYSCDVTGSSISFTDYGQDCSCNTYDGTNDAIFYQDNSLSSGTIGTFNCNGESNWMERWSFYILSPVDVACNDGVSAVCCPLEWLNLGGPYEYFPLPVITATGVCVDGTDGYVMAECGLGFGFVYTWDTNTCDGNKLLPIEGAQSDECALKADVFNYDVITGNPTSRLCTYNLLYNCYNNGVAVNTQSICADVSTTIPPGQTTTSSDGDPQTTDSKSTAEPVTSTNDPDATSISTKSSEHITTISGDNPQTTDPSNQVTDDPENTDTKSTRTECEEIGGDGCIKYFDGCNECFCSGNQEYCTDNECVSIGQYECLECENTMDLVDGVCVENSESDTEGTVSNKANIVDFYINCWKFQIVALFISLW